MSAYVEELVRNIGMQLHFHIFWKYLNGQVSKGFAPISIAGTVLSITIPAVVQRVPFAIQRFDEKGSQDNAQLINYTKDMTHQSPNKRFFQTSTDQRTP